MSQTIQDVGLKKNPFFSGVANFLKLNYYDLFKMRKLLWTWMLLLCVVSGFCGNIMELKKGQKLDVIIPEKSSKTVKFAAEELAKYLKQIAAVEATIKSEAQTTDTDSARINLGSVSANAELVKLLKGKDVETHVLNVDKGSLGIVGNGDRALLYGVYQLLEDLGCVWAAPGIDYTPELNELKFNYDRKIFSPGIKYRSIRYFTVTGKRSRSWKWLWSCVDWAAKNRVNVLTNRDMQEFPKEIQKRGGCRGINNSHLTEYVFSEELFKEKPEIFAVDANGKTMFEANRAIRPGGIGQQFCWSAPASVDVFADYIIKRIEQTPEVELFPITPADGIKYCQCAKCLALYKKFPQAEGGALLEFSGKVADKVNARYPDKKFYDIAYNKTKFTPPPDFKLQRNIIIVNCHNFDWLHTFATAKNGNFLEQCRAWNKVSKFGFGAYDYYPSSEQKFMPLACQLKIVGDVKSVYDLGGSYFELQSDPQTVGWYLFIYYAGARAMWDPTLNAKKEMAKYYSAMFGPGAPYVEQFFTIFEDARENYPKAGRKPYDIFSRQLFERCDPILAQALKAVAGNQRYQDRVQAVVDHYNYGKYYHYGLDAYAKFIATNDHKYAEGANQCGEAITKLVDDVKKQGGVRRTLSVFDWGVLSRHHSGTGVEISTWKSAAESQKAVLPIKPGIRVGLLTAARGTETLLSALNKTDGIKAMEVATLNKEALAQYSIIIVNNTNGRGVWFSESKDSVRAWVEAGGCLILLHDAVGYRGHKPLFPEIGQGVFNPRNKTFKKSNATHPATAKLKDGEVYDHDYYDHITIKPGPSGKALIVDKDNNAVVVAGKYGKGYVVLNGMLCGYGTRDGFSYNPVEPIGGELDLLVGSVEWLAKVRFKGLARAQDIAVIDPMTKSSYRKTALALRKSLASGGKKAVVAPVDKLTDLDWMNTYKVIALPIGGYPVAPDRFANLEKFVFAGGLAVIVGRSAPAITGVTAGGSVRIEDFFVIASTPVTTGVPLEQWVKHNSFNASKVAMVDGIELARSKFTNNPKTTQPYLTYKLYGKGAFVFLNCRSVDDEFNAKILENSVSDATLEWLTIP